MILIISVVFLFFQPSVQRMKNDPLRYHEGLKIPMAVAMGDAMKGLVERMSEVCQFVMIKFC